MDDQMDDHASSRLPAHSKERNMILKVTTSAFLDVGDLGSVIGFSGKYQDKLRKTNQSINEISINLSSYPSFLLSFFLLFRFFSLFFFSIYHNIPDSVMNYDKLKRKQTSKEAGKSRKNKEAGTHNPKEHPQK